MKNLTEEEKSRKSFIPYAFLIFFGVIFAVDAGFVYMAKKTSRGLYTKDSYRKGLDYNESLDLARKQKDLGWDLRMNYKKIGTKIGLIKVTLRDKNGDLIKDAKLFAVLRRPTQAGHDFKREFVENNGIYETRIAFELQGVWDVEVQAIRGDDAFQKVKRYVIR